MIIYHGALTSRPDLVRFGKPLSVLEPFEMICSKGIKRQPWWDKYFLDSGAFHVSQGGAPMELSPYIDWLKVHKDEVDIYACLDVVGNGYASLQNYEKMLSAGLRPIPVYHDGEPLEILRRYAETTDYIGLGAVSHLSAKQRLVFFDRVFALYPDSTKVRFHGFGVLAEELLLRYPWYSVDSTTVCTTARFGGFMSPWGPIRVSEKVAPGDIKWKTDAAEEVVRTWVSSIGFSYDIAMKGTREGTAERIFITLKYYEDFREKVPIIFKPKHKIVSVLSF